MERSGPGQNVELRLANICFARGGWSLRTRQGPSLRVASSSRKTRAKVRVPRHLDDNILQRGAGDRRTRPMRTVTYDAVA